MIIKKKLLILGAGGHGKICAECAMKIGDYSLITFLDDDYKNRKILECEVRGGFRDYLKYINDYDEFFVAVGDNEIRMLWLEKLMRNGYKAAVLIHPNSEVSDFCQIGMGSIIAPTSVVNAGAVLGVGVIVNTGAIIEHDCKIENGVHISPGAIIAGNSSVGKCSWICIGAKVSNNVKVGKETIIAANSFVIRDIGNNLMAAGTPAVVKKSLD